MEDLTFRLDIIETDGHWHISCSSPLGGQDVQIPAPYGGAEFQRVLLDTERSLIRSRSTDLTRAAGRNDVRQFGARLAHSVLTDNVRVIFERCRSQAKIGHGSLRILLNPVGPMVSQVPWEFLVDPEHEDDFLALRVPVVRSPKIMNQGRPLRIDGPLRVLGITARPDDRPALDLDRERQEISRSLRELNSPDLYVEWLPGDRWDDLSRALHARPWHVLHFMGHAGYDRDEETGYVELSGDNGASLRVSAVDFARTVTCLGQLRLVVLNACDSAACGAGGALTGTAGRLMTEGVPAVVAMQYEITDKTAIDFAASFYREITSGRPVDIAMTTARERIKVTKQSLEWATPVLYLSSGQARVFDLPGASRGHRPGGSGREQTAEQPRAQLGPCCHAALGPRELLAVACDDGSVRVHRLPSGDLIRECCAPGQPPPQKLAWSPSPRHLASVHGSDTVVVWDVRTEVPVHILRLGHRVQALAFSASGSWLAASGDGTVSVFSSGGTIVRTIQLPPMGTAGGFERLSLDAVAFVPGDRAIVAAGADGGVRRVGLTGQVTVPWRHPRAVTAMAIRDDRLATASADTRVRTWSWGGEPKLRLESAGQIAHLAFSDTGTLLAAASTDGTITIWTATGHTQQLTATNGIPAGLAIATNALVVVKTTGEVIELPYEESGHGKGGQQ